MNLKAKLEAIANSLPGKVTGGKYADRRGKMVKFDPFSSMDSVRMMLICGLKVGGPVTDTKHDCVYHSQSTRFVVELFCILTSITPNKFEWSITGIGAIGIFNMLTAYPEQYAEAYGRTLELW